jgi:hypothetical protein
MAKSSAELACGLLEGKRDDFEVVRIHQFEDDVEAHDDAIQGRIANELQTAFSRLCEELIPVFGRPTRTGTEDDELIPLGGVYGFAVWDVEGRFLYAAVAHEDRECPYLLVLGVRSEESRG